MLYTFKKEDDFGTTLVSGPYSSSALGYTFAAAKRFGGRKTAFSDFEEYAPSDGAPEAVESRWALAAGGLVALVTVLVLFTFLALLSTHTNGVHRRRAQP